MIRGRPLFVIGVLMMSGTISAASCQRARTVQPEYQATATIKDIMMAIVDPSADVVWGAVQSVSGPQGMQDIAPRTDEEWKNTRAGAIRLVEATNLLLMPGRHVASPGEKSEAEDELEPAQIETLINRDRQAWNSRVRALHDAAEATLHAVDVKNAEEVFALGERIEHACESCHTQYWYPNQKLPPGYDQPDPPAESIKQRPAAAPAGKSTGTIRGHVVLAGTPPGNLIIRMGVDPQCAAANAGKRRVQEAVLTGADGSLANVFVKVLGAFPDTPVPAHPVTIDQSGCVYTPRVVGARVGQKLVVRNSDALLHNVHSQSPEANRFNVGQPTAGIVNEFQLKPEPDMLRIGCDIHRWMTTYVGIVAHPYFAVSGREGGFEIPNVPAGNYSIQVWHERFGTLTQAVRVPAGEIASVKVTFKAGPESERRSRTQ